MIKEGGNMNIHNYHLLFLLSVLIWAGSCISSQEEAPEESRTASVKLVFDTRSGNDVSSQNILPNEGIKELRVIIVDSKGVVIRNELRPVDNNNGLCVFYSLLIYDLPMNVPYTFYVIANEKSFSGDLSVYAEGASINSLADKVISNNVPPIQIPFGLPISGICGPGTFTKSDNIEQVDLVRAVAKINLILKNPTSSKITLSGIAFGDFFTTETKLFSGPGAGVEIGDKYTSLMYSDIMLTIPQATEAGGYGEATWGPVYLYETAVGSTDAYTLQLTRNDGIVNNMKPFLDAEGTPFTKIDRNTCINLTATIWNKAEVQVNYKVVPWDKENIIVPPFN